MCPGCGLFIRQPLFGLQVALLEQNTDRLVLIEFFAPWCASCKALYPKLSKFCEQNPNIVIGKVNFEENREIAKKLGVKVRTHSSLACASVHVSSGTPGFRPGAGGKALLTCHAQLHTLMAISATTMAPDASWSSLPLHIKLFYLVHGFRA